MPPQPPSRDPYPGKAPATACWAVVPGASTTPAPQMTHGKVRAKVLITLFVHAIDCMVLSTFANDVSPKGILSLYFDAEIAREWSIVTTAFASSAELGL